MAYQCTCNSCAQYAVAELNTDRAQAVNLIVECVGCRAPVEERAMRVVARRGEVKCDKCRKRVSR